MVKTKKRIIIITASAIVLSFLLISSIFSALQFSTFNSFSSFPAFFRVISGSEDVIEVDDGNIMMCSPTNSVEKLTAYLKANGVERDPGNDMGGRIGFTENNEKIQLAVRINGYYALFTRV